MHRILCNAYGCNQHAKHGAHPPCNWREGHVFCHTHFYMLPRDMRLAVTDSVNNPNQSNAVADAVFWLKEKNG